MLEIKTSIIFEQSIRNSRFITYLIPVFSEEDAKQEIRNVKKIHPKATHHCSAYIIDAIVRSNDDGEPASTAGMPMLSVLQGKQLNHVLVVVVRYFGKILLGGGGLIQAYTSSVQQALAQAQFLYPTRVEVYHLAVPYDLLDKIETQSNKTLIILKRDYNKDVEYQIETSDPDLIGHLQEQCGGQLTVRSHETIIKMKEEPDNEYEGSN